MTIASDFNKSGLVDRVKNILLKPAETWGVIDQEPATVNSLYTGYAAILAAIPPVAGFIGGQVFGVGVFGITYHPPFIGSLVGAILQYVLSLVGIYIVALIIDALAPSFDGQKNRVQAMKVAAYSYTAAWVAGIFGLVPALSLLSILGGLYSLYLLYLGLPQVMHAPQAKAMGYTAVTVIVAIVIMFVTSLIVGALGIGAITAAGGGHLTSGAGSSGSAGTLHIGGATVDLDKLNAAAKQMEQAGKQVAASTNGEAGDTKAAAGISSDILQSYLPSSFAGYSRGDVEANSGGIAGFSGTNVEAQYSKGDAHMKLSITDLNAAGGFAALAGQFGVETSKQTANGYEKLGKVDGRMTTEEWHKDSKSGKYGVLVADRFMIEADGEGADMDDLKAAIGAVGPNKLEKLAKK